MSNGGGHLTNDAPLAGLLFELPIYSCWAQLKMFTGCGVLALVSTPPKVRKQNCRAHTMHVTSPTLGRTAAVESKTVELQQDTREKDSMPWVERWRDGGKTRADGGESTQRSGAGNATALKTPERQRQSGKPRLTCQKRQMCSDTGQSLPCLYRSEPCHPGNHSECVSMAAREPLHADGFQHSSRTSAFRDALAKTLIDMILG